jgi:ATP-binding cassette subfamily B protein
MLMSWAQGVFAIDVGQVLKKRLLYGALRLEPEEIRNQGAGQHLGRVIESSAVGSLALAAGFSGIMAVVEIVIAAAVLSMGSGGLLHTLLLALWAGLTAAVVYRYYRQTITWTDNRLEMTHDLVERMVGHRTRLAQEEPRRWHDGEDEALERHLALSMGMDRTSLRLSVWLARGWMLVGLAGLAPAFVAGTGTAGLLAVGLGGVILASRALATFESSLASLSAAAVAWRQASLLFKAASRPKPFTSPSFVTAPQQQSDESGSVIDADDVVFRYRDRGEPVLRGCSLEVRSGDRVLLEGPSGGGKSTLVSVLTGLREPESGLILLRGLDRQTIGADGWRRLVATAPQFQENHVLTGTFAFNLLMGRRWPAPNEDLAEAEEVCRDLGLGPLLDRMPAGLQQTVGETGWRLSHGEQSRLFIARALLQDADLVVLDESFAALDPESLELAMSSALRRSKSLLVVAHP